jgi:hypothetical protein
VAPFFRSRPQLVAACVVLVLLGAIGFLPLFDGPGYEQSLATGLVAPEVCAIAVAIEVSAAVAVDPLTLVARGVASGAFLAGVALLTALLHGLRSGMCDLLGGLQFFGFTAGIGTLLGGCWGGLVGEACRHLRRRRIACVVGAMLAPVAGIVVSIVRFCATPIIFAFDPFFGYFSGALYDTVVDVRSELWTYRAGSGALLVGIALLAASLTRSSDGALRLRPAKGHARVAACRIFAGISLLASLGVAMNGAALGHWQTADTIARALGGRASGSRCDVLYPDSLLPAQVDLLVRDCEEELEADEQRLGARLDGRITEYVFADSDQKRALMGAAETSIAKPWRHEVYVQYARYPHPILGHEIAHVVAGSFATGPFRVGGGLWPNPGLIEGVAVATSPDDDELTGAQWARAMLDLGILPNSRRLFSLDFLGQGAAKSYTVAGAFVSWIIGRWGPATVRAWYGGASIEKLTGTSWAALDYAFRGWLSTLPMPADASAYAHARFDRPAVWGRRCPHLVDALDRAADRCRDERRFARAASLYGRSLAADPSDWHARYDRARVEAGHLAEPQGRAELAAIASDENAPRTWRDRAEEAVADDELSQGLVAAAQDSYRRLAARTLDEDVARTLEVKALGAASEDGRRAIVDLLIGSAGRPPDAWLGGLSVGRWVSDGDPLAAYLVGKNLAAREDWSRAATWLARADREGPPTARIAREVLRESAVCACARKDAEAIGRIAGLIVVPTSPFAENSGSRREWVLRLLARCSPESRSSFPK